MAATAKGTFAGADRCHLSTVEDLEGLILTGQHATILCHAGQVLGGRDVRTTVGGFREDNPRVYQLKVL